MGCSLAMAFFAMKSSALYCWASMQIRLASTTFRSSAFRNSKRTLSRTPDSQEITRPAVVSSLPMASAMAPSLTAAARCRITCNNLRAPAVDCGHAALMAQVPTRRRTCCRPTTSERFTSLGLAEAAAHRAPDRTFLFFRMAPASSPALRRLRGVVLFGLLLGAILLLCKFRPQFAIVGRPEFRAQHASTSLLLDLNGPFRRHRSVAVQPLMNGRRLNAKSSSE